MATTAYNLQPGWTAENVFAATEAVSVLLCNPSSITIPVVRFEITGSSSAPAINPEHAIPLGALERQAISLEPGDYLHLAGAKGYTASLLVLMGV